MFAARRYDVAAWRCLALGNVCARWRRLVQVVVSWPQEVQLVGVHTQRGSILFLSALKPNGPRQTIVGYRWRAHRSCPLFS